MYKNITKIALRGTTLAMGVAVLVMSTLKTLDIHTGVAMLGLGLASLALANLQDNGAYTTLSPAPGLLSAAQHNSIA